MSDWRLKILVEEDEDAFPVTDRFTVWLAPSGDRRVQHRLGIGAGETRADAIEDARVELQGALTLLEPSIVLEADDAVGTVDARSST